MSRTEDTHVSAFLSWSWAAWLATWGTYEPTGLGIVGSSSSPSLGPGDSPRTFISQQRWHQRQTGFPSEGYDPHPNLPP